MISIQRRKVHDCSLTISIVGQVQDGDDIAYNGYWVGKDCETGTVTLYSKQKWEPVPTETWRDVTEECNVDESILLHVEAQDSVREVADLNTAAGYRLRKVRLFGRKLDQERLSCYEEVDAFIIERKYP